jgi:hypothetical protein
MSLDLLKDFNHTPHTPRPSPFRAIPAPKPEEIVKAVSSKTWARIDRKRFHGSCYRSANWIELGETTGRGRMARTNERHGAQVETIARRNHQDLNTGGVVPRSAKAHTQSHRDRRKVIK